MESNKMMALLVVAVVVIAGAGGFAIWKNNKDKDDEEVEISIAYLNLGYYPFMIGFEKGFFDDLDFKVKPVLVEGSGNVSVEALTSGAATMAATGDGPFANAFGKNPDDIIGLCQWTQAFGSLSGHQWIVKTAKTYPSLGGNAVTSIAKDSNGITTNSADVANDIKTITAAGEGKQNGKFMISVNQGSTTHTYLMKWCIANNLTYTTDASKSADVYINAIPKATAATFTEILNADGTDAVACNNSIYGSLNTGLGDAIKKISDSSAINEASYGVLCTTKANYEKYSEQMLKVLEKLKEIYAWMDENWAESARILADLTNQTEEAVKKNYDSTARKIVWETDKLDGWVSTAKIGGYNVTADQFAKACPDKIKNTINGWYA